MSQICSLLCFQGFPDWLWLGFLDWIVNSANQYRLCNLCSLSLNPNVFVKLTLLLIAQIKKEKEKKKEARKESLESDFCSSNCRSFVRKWRLILISTIRISSHRMKKAHHCQRTQTTRQTFK